jgi:sugar/nucleoside kinase (ribokinase family)
MLLDVAGFGESSVDFVHVLRELPRAGATKLPIASHYSACGGQVATTLSGCAALGLKTSFLGVVGTDDNGQRIRRELRERGVDLSRLVVRAAPSRYAVILVEEASGDRVVLSSRDSRLDLPPDEIRRDLLPAARLVHVDATDEAASIVIARLARAQGAVVTCDVDAVTGRTRELLSHVTIPILADGVPQALTGISDMEAALREMRSTHEGTIVATLGERGCAALEGDRFVESPGVEVAPVDTTGAGDIFRAGFIYGHLHGWPLERTLRFANAAAAASCTRQGAMAGAPSLDEVLALVSVA